jgi:glycosyltransferase involved in cell wall biosynthesis
MEFSVIVPCFNNERYLRQCLTSLCTQTYPRDRYEVIFVDNNSTDRSVQIARDFPELTVLEEPFQSSYAARNLGVRQASGEYLVFTDSDCEVCPTWLEEMRSSLSEPATALVLGSNRNARESFTLRMVADYEAQKAEYVCTQPNKDIYYGYTNNMAVRRKVFEQCGPFRQIARGADVIFVSGVLDAYGAESVRYAHKAQLRHLEISRVSDWYRKMGTYGRSYESYRAWSHTRPLDFRERLEVFRRTVARNHYAWPRALSLGVLLAVGVIPFELGRILQTMPRISPRQT